MMDFKLQVCSPGDSSQVTTKDYTCPRPLKGRYVTVQKTQGDADDPIYVNEVDVEVMVF